MAPLPIIWPKFWAIADVGMKRIARNQIGIVQGSRVLFSDFVNGGPLWTGEGARESRHVVNFSEAFAGPPAVTVGISLWDVDHKANLRGDITAENVTERGFHIVFRTWGDTRIARLRADWLAIGPVKDEDQWDVD